MVRHPCPHCGRDGISGFRRVALGPALPTRCSECRRRVGVPWWSIVTAVPFVLAMCLAVEAAGSGVRLGFLLGSFGTAVMFMLGAALVPLVKR